MGPQEPGDIELMALVARGRDEAFAEIVRRHQQPLLNFFRRMGAYTEGEDLVQETLLRVFRHSARYRPSAKFTTFLYTVARHAWADRLRKDRRSPEIDPATQAEETGADADGPARSDAKMDLQAALDRLSEKLREVVVLGVFQGRRYREIAEILEIPVGTVKSRMSLALEALRKVMGSYGDSGKD